MFDQSSTSNNDKASMSAMNYFIHHLCCPGSFRPSDPLLYRSEYFSLSFLPIMIILLSMIKGRMLHDGHVLDA